MKKLVLMFVAVAAISFASCGNNTKAGENVDSVADSTENVDSVVADSAVADSAVADSIK